MNPLDVVLVGLAGAVGALCRFMADGAIRARYAGRVPVGTVAINVSGSLILGLLAGLVLFHHLPSDLTLVAGSGFCGGFTTFSTSSFETVRLVQRGEGVAAVVNLGTTIAGALAAAALGLALASL